MRLLFVHGAGGQDDDRPLADALAGVLGAELDYPVLPEDDMSYEAWAGPIRRSLGALTEHDAVVAHSHGAAMLLNVLTERRWRPARAVLLAMPDWGPDGWNVPEYAFNGPEPAIALTLHRCRDDEVVPHSHQATHAIRLRRAMLLEYADGGHQFAGQVDAIVAHLTPGSMEAVEPPEAVEPTVSPAPTESPGEAGSREPPAGSR